MSWDESALLWVNQGLASPAMDVLMVWLSSLPDFGLPLLVILGLDAFRRDGAAGLRLWGFLVLAVLLGDHLGADLKEALGQPRPCLTHFDLLRAPEGGPLPPCSRGLDGMPSNHALNFTLAATLVWLASPWQFWRWLLPPVAALVGLSRVYLGVHFPSQVLWGAALGAAVGLLAWRMACYHRLRLPARDPPPDAHP